MVEFITCLAFCSLDVACDHFISIGNRGFEIREVIYGELAILRVFVYIHKGHIICPFGCIEQKSFVMVFD